LKTAGQILTHFYMVKVTVTVYIRWFYKSNNSRRSWPWRLTLRAKIVGSAQICIPLGHSLAIDPSVVSHYCWQVLLCQSVAETRLRSAADQFWLVLTVLLLLSRASSHF